MGIQNTQTLLSHGNLSGRRIALEIIEAGLEAADPYTNVRKMIRLENGKLVVGHRDFDVSERGIETLDLSKIGAIYVLGAGKAAQRMAKGIEDILGDRITGGAVNAKKGEGKFLKRIEVTLAGHPVPDEDSVAGSKRILEMADRAREGDLVFCVVSGGVSSLLTLPADGLSLKDKREVTRILQIKHGVPTSDLNMVRGRLSGIKDGRIAVHIRPAKMIVIMTWGGLSNASYEQIMSHNGTNPFFPSANTYRDAIDRINKWGAWDEMPQAVRDFLKRADPRFECPKRKDFEEMDISIFQVMHSGYMLQGARKKTEELGLTPVSIPRVGSGTEAGELGKVLGEIAKEIECSGVPCKPPCVLISDGESIVTVGEEAEHALPEGGRNQEFVLSSALRIGGSRNITVAAVDSDGTDGPTTAAGGIADGYTLKEAKKHGVNIFDALRRHSTTSALTKMGNVIITGNTGTNTMDLRIVFIDKAHTRGA